MEATRMPRITASDTIVPISQPKNSCPIIFTPIKHSRSPKPYFSSHTLSVKLRSRKNSYRSPMMAKIFEK